MQVTIGPAILSVVMDPKLSLTGGTVFHVSITLLGTNHRIDGIRWKAHTGTEREIMGYLLAFLGVADQTNYFSTEVLAWADVWQHEIRDMREDIQSPRVTCSFATVTPESAEAGDYEGTGWIDSEGEIMAEDADQSVEEKTTAFLLSKGAINASSTDWHPGVWYSDGGTESPFKAEETTRSYHLENFTEAESRAIFHAMTKKGGAK